MGTVAIPQGATFQPLSQGPNGSVQIPQGATLQALSHEGEQTNDVGNTVIVPKSGESFLDTIKRAGQYGKTVTPQQINAQMATAPKKVAQVLTAAPVIGAAGAALGPTAEAAAPVAKAAASWSAAHPLWSAFGYHVARELGIPLPKVLDVMSKFHGEGTP